MNALVQEAKKCMKTITHDEFFMDGKSVGENERGTMVFNVV